MILAPSKIWSQKSQTNIVISYIKIIASLWAFQHGDPTHDHRRRRPLIFHTFNEESVDNLRSNLRKVLLKCSGSENHRTSTLQEYFHLLLLTFEEPEFFTMHVVSSCTRKKCVKENKLKSHAQKIRPLFFCTLIRSVPYTYIHYCRGLFGPSISMQKSQNKNFPRDSPCLTPHRGKGNCPLR